MAVVLAGDEMLMPSEQRSDESGARARPLQQRFDPTGRCSAFAKRVRL
jgi:hypothetical protein